MKSKGRGKSKRILHCVILFILFVIKFFCAADSKAATASVKFNHIGVEEGLSQNTVDCIIQDRYGFMWFGTADGLNRYDGYEFKIYSYDPDDPHSISDNYIHEIYEDREGILWIGTDNGGLNRFDRFTEKFRHYRHDPEEPSSINSDLILSICEDRFGDLWIGTARGLNKMTDRYRGRFLRYSYIPDNEDGLGFPAVGAIYEDKQGTLWIGTGNHVLFRGGLQRFDREKGVFEFCRSGASPEEFFSYGPLNDIFEDSRSNLWIATGGDGVYKLNPDKTEIEHYYRNYPQYDQALFEAIEDGRQADRVLAEIMKAENDGHYIEVFRIEEKRQALVFTLGEAFAGMLFDYAWIESVESREVIWGMDLNESQWAGGHVKNRIQMAVITFEPGNYELHFKTDGSHSYGSWNTRAPDHAEYYGVQVIALPGKDAEYYSGLIEEEYVRNENSISGVAVTSVCEDQDGDIWIGSAITIQDGGLTRYDPEAGKFYNYYYDPADPHSLSDNSIFSLYVDRAGALWVGTQRGGISRHNKTYAEFQHFYSEPSDPDGLHSNEINHFYQDDLGNIWIGAGGGLHRFDMETGKFKHYEGTDYIMSIAQDRDGLLWLAAIGPGLIMFDPESEQFHFKDFTGTPDEEHRLTSPVIQSLIFDERGEMWAGTTNGLNKFISEEKGFRQYRYDPENPKGLSHYNITALYSDRPGILWVGTKGGGLNKLLIDRNEFIHYKYDPEDPESLSHNRITSIYRDANDILWIGTDGGGLNRFNERSETFTRYTERNGLAGNVIRAILSDDDGNLWLSSNKGITRFDPIKRTFINYDVNDGLQGNEFNACSRLKTDGGYLLFGGKNGFNMFEPENIKHNPYPPPIVINSISTIDEVLKTQITQETHLDLDYDQNSLSFEFAALDFTNPRKNFYAYRLIGADNDWIYSRRRRYASYTNLKGGDYVFQVKGANSDGVWNEKGVSVSISLALPPWKTPAAYFVYILIGLLIIFLIIRFRVNRERQKARVREAELKEQAATSQAKASAARAEAVEADNRRKTEELERARTLQLSMLPEGPIHLPNLDIAMFMKTATEVGGDYYDLFPQPDGSLFLVTGDATGHGLSAGMMVSMTKASLHAVDVLSPDQILKRLNYGLKRTNPGNMKMALNILHIQRNMVKFSSAGMPPLFIFRSQTGDVEENLLSALPLGSFDYAEFPLKISNFDINDTIILISDGLPERRNGDDDYLGYNAVRDCIGEYGKQPVENIVEALVDLGENWANGVPNHDDVTVLAVRRTE